jgi:hypothetical protein
MAESTTRSEAFDWLFAKLAAARSKAQPKVPIYTPPKVSLAPPTVESPAEKQKNRGLLRDKEEAMWHKWMDGGQRSEDFEALKKSHMPIINNWLSRFKGAEVNRVTQKAELVQHYRKALEKWDPSHPSGARLNTWVENNLRGIKRFVVWHQNPARIHEDLAKKITPYNAVKHELTEKMGFEPSSHQIADASKGKLSLKDVLQVESQVRRNYDITAGGEKVEGVGHHAHDPYLQAAHVVYPELKPHEQKVHELMFPRTDHAPVVKSGAIAKKLRWEVSKVSKAKRAIMTKILERVGD